MKFSLSRETLLDAINTVQRAASNRTTLEILEGILLVAEKNALTLIATDLDLSIETIVNANIIEEGSVVVNSKLFGEYIRRLPNDNVLIEVDGTNVNITCLKSEFLLVGNPPDEFPKLPSINENTMYSISQDFLRNMIKETIFAIAQDETRPILTGVLFEVKDKKLSFVSLDGYRLALKTADIDTDKEINAVIPGKALNEIAKILEVSDEEVKITFTPNHILFNLNKTKVISRLLNGEFINYRQIIPQEYRLRVKVFKNDLLNSIERASLISKEGKGGLVKFNIEDGMIRITSNSKLGKVNEEVNAKLEGEGLKIAFNGKYFLDVLRIIDSEEIYLEFSTSVSPCLLKKSDSLDYTYLVLPVRMIED